MPTWLQEHRALLDGALLVAIAVSVVGIVVVPWMIARIPRDYFARPEAPPLPWADAHPLLRAMLSGAKNFLGGVLVVAGLAMLVMPGQGILTLMIGGMLLDFPGKRALELRMVRMGRVKRVLDWIRARAGRAPLEVGEGPGKDLHSPGEGVDPGEDG